MTADCGAHLTETPRAYALADLLALLHPLGPFHRALVSTSLQPYVFMFSSFYCFSYAFKCFSCACIFFRSPGGGQFSAQCVFFHGGQGPGDY